MGKGRAMRVAILFLLVVGPFLLPTSASADKQPCYKNFKECVRTFQRRGFANAASICSSTKIRYCGQERH